MSNENTRNTDPKQVSAGNRAEAKPEAVEAQREQIQAQLNKVSAAGENIIDVSEKSLAGRTSAGTGDPGQQSVKARREPVEGLAHGISAAGGTGGGNSTGERKSSNELKDQRLA